MKNLHFELVIVTCPKCFGLSHCLFFPLSCKGWSSGHSPALDYRVPVLWVSLLFKFRYRFHAGFLSLSGAVGLWNMSSVHGEAVAPHELALSALLAHSADSQNKQVFFFIQSL